MIYFNNIRREPEMSAEMLCVLYTIRATSDEQPNCEVVIIQTVLDQISV